MRDMGRLLPGLLPGLFVSGRCEVGGGGQGTGGGEGCSAWRRYCFFDGYGGAGARLVAGCGCVGVGAIGSGTASFSEG